MIIGICGFISSGKDTTAEYLVKNHNFIKLSFANAVKDALSSIFSWNREYLEGATPESRIWRETIDSWWATRLNIPNFSPRWAMQNFATNIMRKHLHNDIWIACIERKILLLLESNINQNIIITDCRFPNEIKFLKNLGAKIWWIRRADLPIWYNMAISNINKGIEELIYDNKVIHYSEWAWINTDYDTVINNNGNISNLYKQIKNVYNVLINYQQTGQDDMLEFHF